MIKPYIARFHYNKYEAPLNERLNCTSTPVSMYTIGRSISDLGGLGLLFLIQGLVLSCDNANTFEPDAPSGSGEGVEIVIVGEVIRQNGTAVEEALIGTVITHGVEQIVITQRTDSEGRFEINHRDARTALGPAQVQLQARPEIGEGYQLGITEANLEVEFQPIPASDTTFVQLVLPPNSTESRRPVWVAPISFRATTRPLRTDADHVFYSVPAGVTALDIETGDQLWRAGNAGVSLAGLPYSVVGDVVIVARQNIITGLSATSGAVLWSNMGGPVFPFAVSEPDGLVATDGTTLASFSAHSGALLWEVPIQQGGDPALSLDKNLVCIERLVSPPASARIECFTRSSGSFLWARFIGSPDWMTVTDHGIFLAGGDSERELGWIAVDPETGRTIWQSDIRGDQGPAIRESLELIIACNRSPSHCVAVRTSNGELLWQKSFDHAVGAPSTSQEFVYVVAGESPKSLFVLDALSGELQERIDPDPHDAGGFCATPAVQNGRIFVFGCDGFLYAFNTD